uniref:Uncharacterized protein n=1 Tax=Trichogramma kaykai TaxID=54128 RepID=A0ABD2W1Y3_9HYME
MLVEKKCLLLSRIIGIFTAVVTCIVGLDCALNGHELSLYIFVSSFIIFFFETEWMIDFYIRDSSRSTESIGVRCWSVIYSATSGWKKGLFYLPLACILAWISYNTWLYYSNALLLLSLTIMHSATHNTPNSAVQVSLTHSVNQNLLNTTSDCHNHFEEVLIIDDCVGSRRGFGECHEII